MFNTCTSSFGKPHQKKATASKPPPAPAQVKLLEKRLKASDLTRRQGKGGPEVYQLGTELKQVPGSCEERGSELPRSWRSKAASASLRFETNDMQASGGIFGTASELGIGKCAIERKHLMISYPREKPFWQR